MSACTKCHGTGRRVLSVKPSGERIHSEYLDCHYCGKADELAELERATRHAHEWAGQHMRKDALYPQYRVMK